MSYADAPRGRNPDEAPHQPRRPALRAFPKLRELRSDDVLVGNIAGEDPDVAAELVHSGNERP